ncbi:Uncharacterised protein [Neisseria animaloris]|uniref:hypothetical protein n=1 Tax=Neisseria animaloris TaxID=326522 RepID=UPI000A194B75|nr:hypothetical protein [Neisseria animaloris]OSI08826.1 hypothetical protein BWD08_01550 [Neisseria animaloris]VEH87205.1 Uncharacterised protein [Neisseria animaloris]
MERYALSDESYSKLWDIKKTTEFNKALSSLAFNAEAILRRTFYNFKCNDGEYFWHQKTQTEMLEIEKECNKAIELFEEREGEPYNYRTFCFPVTEGLAFEQNWKTIVEMQHFITTKAIYDYVSEFEHRTFEDNFYELQSVANLITESIVLINIEREEGEIGMEKVIENARKAGCAKQSPYQKAGTIAAVNELLKEKKRATQPTWRESRIKQNDS